MKAIFIHCSATGPDSDIGADVIRGWHKGQGWSDIGYHYVIRRDGTLEKGRDLDGDGDVEDEQGAHAYGHNRDTLGICMVGGVDSNGKPDSNFTRHQWATLDKLVNELKGRYPEADIRGHREVAAKACPSFDAHAWWYG